jgi:hypothetical protein
VYAATNFAETCAWGGWLRATDTFSLDDEDVEIITPANGALHNLHIGVGAVLLTLGPETKGQSSKRVDVPLADTFASGISPHYWYLKLMECKEFGMDRGGSIMSFQWPKMDQFIFQEHTCVPFVIYSKEPWSPQSSPL